MQTELSHESPPCAHETALPDDKLANTPRFLKALEDAVKQAPSAPNNYDALWFFRRTVALQNAAEKDPALPRKRAFRHIIEEKDHAAVALAIADFVDRQAAPQSGLANFRSRCNDAERQALDEMAAHRPDVIHLSRRQFGYQALTALSGGALLYGCAKSAASWHDEAARDFYAAMAGIAGLTCVFATKRDTLATNEKRNTLEAYRTSGQGRELVRTLLEKTNVMLAAATDYYYGAAAPQMHR